MTGNACFSYRLARGGGESTHVILVRLRGVFGVLAFSVQGIFNNCRLQQSAFAINDGHSDAQSSKVNSRNDGHGQTSPSGKPPCKCIQAESVRVSQLQLLNPA